MTGNVVTGANDFLVNVDPTPPEATFPDLRPNCLTSQSFTAIWDAYDATSWVDSEVAYLDNVLVDKGQVIDLAMLAGLHTLRAILHARVPIAVRPWQTVRVRFHLEDRPCRSIIT